MLTVAVQPQAQQSHGWGSGGQGEGVGVGGTTHCSTSPSSSILCLLILLRPDQKVDSLLQPYRTSQGKQIRVVVPTVRAVPLQELISVSTKYVVDDGPFSADQSLSKLETGRLYSGPQLIRPFPAHPSF